MSKPHPLLHETPAGCCKFVLFYVKRRVTTFGPLHNLAVACGQPAARPGTSWCATHRQGLTEPAKFRLSIPADRNVIDRPAPRERTPICEEA